MNTFTKTIQNITMPALYVKVIIYIFRGRMFGIDLLKNSRDFRILLLIAYCKIIRKLLLPKWPKC